MNGKGVFAGGVRAALCALCTLGSVALAATATAAERPDAALAALEALMDGGASDVPAPTDAPCTASSARMPSNIRVDADFLPRVRQMLRRSPTFRAQCERLAANPWVHVAVRLDPTLYDRHSFRAATTIQRPQKKLIIAVVSLQGLADPAMWVSHEFEHLLEQIDAVDVAGLADQRYEAWPSGSGMYETVRAIRAGESVYAEVNGHERASNFVD